MTVDGTREHFGCERCWPSSADDAETASRALTREVDLIDESHFHVMIRACTSCSQQFVSIFTETIDWADGEDPQYWTLMPITREEAADLVWRGGSLSEATLDELGVGRRSLRRDHPKGEAPRSFWDTGILVGPHD